MNRGRDTVHDVSCELAMRRRFLPLSTSGLQATSLKPDFAKHCGCKKALGWLVQHWSNDFHARAAVVHTIGNEVERYPDAFTIFKKAIQDEHPRIRLEAVRGLSYIRTPEAAEVVLQVALKPMDYWIEYTLEHTLHALQPIVDPAIQAGKFLANTNDGRMKYYEDYKIASGPGGRVLKPLKDAENTELPLRKREEALRTLAGIQGGNANKGNVVYSRVCSACHQIGSEGKAFGPRLDDVGSRYSKENIIRHILWPNDTIAKG